MVANAYGGFVSGGVSLEIFKKGMVFTVPYHLNLRLENGDFDKFVKDIVVRKDQKEYQGRISAKLDMSGKSGRGNINKLNGSGYVHIDDGRVFMLPVFGGLSKFMVKHIPGLGVILSQNDLFCKFIITDGKVHTDKLTVDGDVLSLTGRGDYRIGGNLNVYVQVKMMKGKTLGGKIFRTLTYPISKLFEFKVKGDPLTPYWYPVNFSGDIFRFMEKKDG
jgi:hypothetical protein